MVLGKRAGLTIFEAALFGTIVGLILGVLVVLMARLYCRGNLLGDRLRAEREAMDELNEKIQFARDEVASERENALAALAERRLRFVEALLELVDAARDVVLGRAERLLAVAAVHERFRIADLVAEAVVTNGACRFGQLA